MSTRMNIIVKDQYTRVNQWNKPLWFYRHSDGYPDGALPILRRFMQLIKEGKIRNNTEQASGWLILLGSKEYDKEYKNGKYLKKQKPYPFEPTSCDSGMAWKVGAIEPSCGRHGDIEYLYVLDLHKLTITIYETAFDDENIIDDVLPTDKKLAVLTAKNDWQYDGEKQ